MMAGSGYYALLDLLMGYHQVEVAPKDSLNCVRNTQGVDHLQRHALRAV